MTQTDKTIQIELIDMPNTKYVFKINILDKRFLLSKKMARYLMKKIELNLNKIKKRKFK